MEPILEKPAFRLNGFLAFGTELVALGASIAVLREAVLTRSTAFPGPFWYGLGLLLLIALTAPGFFIVHPNEARVLVFLGRYVGSVRASGFWWTNPLTLKQRVSLRVHNFSSEKLKVNDAVGNPIEIAAVIAWRVIDSAQALFNVENYQEFVAIQSETAIRTLASHHPYDVYEESSLSLRAHPDEIAERLRQEVQARLSAAGVEVLEARISHLAYAPEIAQAMLRRQQAQAIIAARQKIVEGAVGMVEMALRLLSENQVVELDEERRAAMVNNLLVALVSEQQAQPIINTGTLYG